jgi:hypothetical protein
MLGHANKLPSSWPENRCLPLLDPCCLCSTSRHGPASTIQARTQDLFLVWGHPQVDSVTPDDRVMASRGDLQHDMKFKWSEWGLDIILIFFKFYLWWRWKLCTQICPVIELRTLEGKHEEHQVPGPPKLTCYSYMILEWTKGHGRSWSGGLQVLPVP